MRDRITALREIISEYEDERGVEATRLGQARLKRERLELAREILLEHGEGEEATHLLLQIQQVDHDIAAHERLIQRYDRILGYFQISLTRAEGG